MTHVIVLARDYEEFKHYLLQQMQEWDAVAAWSSETLTKWTVRASWGSKEMRFLFCTAASDFAHLSGCEYAILEGFSELVTSEQEFIEIKKELAKAVRDPRYL